jgi:hypothetical protein
MQIREIAAILLVSAGLTGCTLDKEGAGDTMGDPAVAGELAGPHDFDVQIDGGTYVRIVASGQWVNDDGSSQSLELGVESGTVAMRAHGDTLSLEELNLGLADLDVGKWGQLTDLRLSLDAPIEAAGRYDDGWAIASSELDLNLDWTLRLPSDQRIELASQQLDDLPFEVQISVESNGSLSLTLELSDSGALIELDDVVRVTGLTAELRAVSD